MSDNIGLTIALRTDRSYLHSSLSYLRHNSWWNFGHTTTTTTNIWQASCELQYFIVQFVAVLNLKKKIQVQVAREEMPNKWIAGFQLKNLKSDFAQPSLKKN